MWKLVVVAACLLACKKEEPKVEKLPAEFKAEAEKIAKGLADEARDGVKAGDLAKTADQAQQALDSADKLAGLADGLAKDVGEDIKAAVGKDGKCVDGKCTQTCAAGKTCSFSCSGGSCEQRCEKDSSCDNSCSGSKCTQSCAAGATCKFTCSGGGCTQTCEGDCKKSCTGDGCK